MDNQSKNSRTRAVALNVVFNAVAQILSILLNLLVRRAFIATLGNEILGLNSLFSSVVGLLTVTELGLGTTIAVFLYKPLAQKDYEKANAYMQLLKKAYYAVGVFIFVVGLLLVPIIHYFVKADIPNSTVQYSFVIYVVAVAITYFFSYKKILLDADLHGYIISGLQAVYKLVLNLGYLVILLLTHNYYLYLVVFLICNFADNFAASWITNRRYPWLYDKDVNKLSRKEIKEVVFKVKAMVLHRVGSAMIEGADNIIISTFLSTVMVAYYSNYRLITMMLNAVIGCLANSTMAAFGNLIHSEAKGVKKAFAKLLLIQHYLYSVTLVGFVVTGTEFVTNMFGMDSKLSLSIVLLIGIAYYIRGYSSAIESLRGAYGVYEKDQYWSVAIAVINIIISIIGVRTIGIAGVILGTIFAYVLKYIVVLPPIVFKPGTGINTGWYLKTWFNYVVLTVMEMVICYFIVSKIYISNEVVSFILKGTICVVLSVIITFVVYSRTEEQREIVLLFKDLLTHKIQH